MDASQTDAAFSIETLLNAARAKEWDKIEELWLQNLTALRPSPQLDRLFQMVKNGKSPAAVMAMLEVLLDGVASAEDGDPQVALQILESGMNHVPVNGAMRAALSRLAARLVPAEILDKVLEKSGLNDDNVRAKQAVDTFMRIHRLIPGEVLNHKYYQHGLVRSVDFDSGLMVMDFPGTQYQNIPVKFEHLEELIKPVVRDSFDALRLREPDTIRTMSDTDPAKLVKLIAHSRRGEISQADIKHLLLQGIFTEAEFKNWWGKRRAEIVRDPWLDVLGAGARCTFKMREVPKAYSSELTTKWLAATDFKSKLEAARSIARAARDNAFPADQWPLLIPPFKAASAGMTKMTAAEKITWELLRQELAKVAPEGLSFVYQVDLVEVLGQTPNPADALMNLECADHLGTMIGVLRDAFPKSWPDHYSELSERVAPRFIEMMHKALLAEKREDLVAESLQRLVSFPERNPDGYMWVMRGLLDGSITTNIGLDAAHLVDALLSVYESLENGPPRPSKEEEKDRRALALRLAKFLSEKNYQVVARVIEKMPVAEARIFFAALDKRRLPKDFLDALRAALTRTRNDLESQQQRASASASLGDDVLMCTEKSHLERLAEYKHINDVEIPNNSKAIGVAREHGDLRENAEYHAAKDQQKVLFRRVEELSMQLRRARIIKPESIDTGRVGFGTRVVVLDISDNKQREFVILGPWESDPSAGIINYQAPLGQSFVGRRPAEEFDVKLPDGATHRFRIERIERAIS